MVRPKGQLAAFIMATLDGRFFGVGGELDCHNVDVKFHAFAAEQLAITPALVFAKEPFRAWPHIGHRPTPVLGMSRVR
jgi:hypothetical protein